MSCHRFDVFAHLHGSNSLFHRLATTWTVLSAHLFEVSFFYINDNLHPDIFHPLRQTDLRQTNTCITTSPLYSMSFLDRSVYDNKPSSLIRYLSLSRNMTVTHYAASADQMVPSSSPSTSSDLYPSPINVCSFHTWLLSSPEIALEWNEWIGGWCMRWFSGVVASVHICSLRH